MCRRDCVSKEVAGAVRARVPIVEREFRAACISHLPAESFPRFRAREAGVANVNSSFLRGREEQSNLIFSPQNSRENGLTCVACGADSSRRREPCRKIGSHLFGSRDRPRGGSDGREFTIVARSHPQRDRIVKGTRSLSSFCPFIPGSVRGGDKRADTCIVVWIR